MIDKKNIRIKGWSTLISHLFHDFHDDSPGSCEDKVTDSPVVQIEHIQPIDRHHKLTHLRTEDTPMSQPVQTEG